MNFKFENLGPIKNGNINVKDLTIICGENNTGKTYVSYALYGFYKSFDLYFVNSINSQKYIKKIQDSNSYEINFEDLYNDRDKIRLKAIERYKSEIYNVFNSTKDLFKELNLDIELINEYEDKEKFFKDYEKGFKLIISTFKNKMIISREGNILRVTVLDTNTDNDEVEVEELINLLLRVTYPTRMNMRDKNVFMLPAERSGINIFFKELNINRNNEIFALNKNANMKKFIKKFSKYALPISDYLNFLNNMEENDDGEEEFKNVVDELEDGVICGKYLIDKDNNIRFLHKDFKENESIDFHIASSTAKTLFSLDYYLKFNAEKGDILIIDEPELNLHPDNQRKLTRILVKMVNKGIKLIISTHSDYIIKEINNLIVLGRKFNGYEELMKKYNYTEDELIEEDRVSAYMLNNKSITCAEIAEEGIIMETFDNVINAYNKSSDDIYYEYMDRIGEEEENE